MQLMPTSVTQRFHFDAGHRLLNHEGKCRYPHGHRYVADVTFSSRNLDSIGRVIDFGQVKERLGAWINERLDHNFLLNPNDPLVEVFCTPQIDKGEKEPFIMPPTAENPTAENIARVLFYNAKGLITERFGVATYHVRVYETPNCWADYPHAMPNNNEELL